jgi:protein-S-isoprenylcysteine O-methyltransferase Ste14
MIESSKITPELLRMAIVRFGLSIIIIPAIFFIPAGTFAYWQAWVYIVVLFAPLGFVLVYLLKYAPGLLERRMHSQEKEKEQQAIVMASFVFFILAFLLPGFDFRFGWSHMPVALVIVSNVLVFAGYMFVFRVFRENRYASRVVEVEEEQSVISTGPYSLVRHPMYLGTSVMYLASPLALGSYWAFIPALFILPILILRLLNEEKVLERDLKGYKEYEAKVKYHLFPGIW